MSMNEISLFIGVSLLFTLIFFFFRSFRATLIANCNYRGDVDLWASWIIQFSNHGTYCCSTHPSYRNYPNCIFLTNKYQQEYVAHGINKAHYSV
jgi:hypothetical protein